MAKFYEFKDNNEAIENAMYRNYEKGNYARCIALLQEKLHTNKRYIDTNGYYADNVEYLVLLAGCYYKLGSVEQARELYGNILTFARNDITLMLSLLEYEPKARKESILNQVCEYIIYVPKDLRPYGKVDIEKVGRDVIPKLLSCLEKARKRRGFSVSPSITEELNKNLEQKLEDKLSKIYAKDIDIMEKEQRILRVLALEIKHYPQCKEVLTWAVDWCANHCIVCEDYTTSERFLKKLVEIDPYNTYIISNNILHALIVEKNTEQASNDVAEFIAYYENDMEELWQKCYKICTRMILLERLDECCFVTAEMYKRFPLHCDVIFLHYCASRIAGNMEESEAVLAQGLKYYPQNARFIFAKTCTSKASKYKIINVFVDKYTELSNFENVLNKAIERAVGVLSIGKRVPKLSNKVCEAMEVLLSFGDFDIEAVKMAFKIYPQEFVNIFLSKLASPDLHPTRRASILQMLVHNSRVVASGAYLKGSRLIPIKLKPLVEEETGQSFAIIETAYAYAQCGLINKYEYVDVELLHSVACKMGEFFMADAQLVYIIIIMMYEYEKNAGIAMNLERVATTSGLDLAKLHQHAKAFGLDCQDDFGEY